MATWIYLQLWHWLVITTRPPELGFARPSSAIGHGFPVGVLYSIPLLILIIPAYGIWGSFFSLPPSFSPPFTQRHLTDGSKPAQRTEFMKLIRCERSVINYSYSRVTSRTHWCSRLTDIKKWQAIGIKNYAGRGPKLCKKWPYRSTKNIRF